MCMLNIRIISALLFMLPASMPAAAQEPHEVQTVRLGFSSPLSGPQSGAGKDALNGTQMAVDRLNRQGLQVGGKAIHFELLSRDDKANPQTGAAVARELVEADVKAVLGPFNSGVALATGKVYNDAGIVSLTVASNPKVTQAAQEHVFRIAASDSDMGRKMAIYAARSLKLKNIAVVEDGSAYAQGLIEEFQKAAKQNGLRIAHRDLISDNAADLRLLLGRVRDAGADAIFFGGYVPQAGALLKQMQQTGIAMPLLGGDALCSSTMVAQAGESLGERTYCVQGGTWLTRVSDGAVFASSYQNKYGKMPDVYAPTFYDGVMLLAQAMKSADSTDPRVFTPALARLRYKGVTATYEFDARHDMKESTVTILRFANGRLVPLSSF